MAVIRPFGEHTPRLEPGVFVASTAAVIGAVELGAEVNVWYGAVLRGDVGRIQIGARTNVQDNATIHMTWELSDAVIGADVVIGHNAVVHGAVVGDGALIGMGAIVMDNAEIGPGAWVAAGSVVPPNTVVPPRTLFRGSPAKHVREVRQSEQLWAQDAIQRYLQLAREHRRHQASGHDDSVK